MDFNIKLQDGKLLKGMIHSPGEKIRAVVILIHGLGEHIQRYSYWAELFTRENIGFSGVDLPGHGRSAGRRGNIKNFSVTDEMIDILLESCRRTFTGVPIFLYGHSLGGGIVLNYLIRKNPQVKGAVITSPWLRLSFEPPKIKLKMAAVMKSIMPGLVQSASLNVNHISHVKEVNDNYLSDPLNHDKISVGLFSSVVSAADYSMEHAADLKIPTLLLHGSADLITSPDASREFAAKSAIVEFRIWEGGYHELHNESFKDDVFAYISNWINGKLA